jgi:hypothetical protein
MIVVVSLVLFLALWGVTFRQTASVIRVASVQTLRLQRDQGSVQAVAYGVTLLETGLPPTSPYVGAVVIQTPTGPRSFTVTFSFEGGTNWSVYATPTAAGDNPSLLPSSFGP